MDEIPNFEFATAAEIVRKEAGAEMCGPFINSARELGELLRRQREHLRVLGVIQRAWANAHPEKDEAETGKEQSHEG